MNRTAPYPSVLDKLARKPASQTRALPAALFFSLLFVFQLVFIFQGADLGDSGSYANFYQQIFNNPESVEYSFMFWLSGFLGGLYLKLFPALGILGIRIAGVAISTATAGLAYRLLRRHLNRGILQLSLFVVVLMINNNPKEFYYNNLSAFLYVATAALLYRGLRQQRSAWIFFSGGLVALNIFNRTPNLLELGISSGIFVYGWLFAISVKTQLRQFLAFLLGVILFTAGTLAVMQFTGQLTYFLNSLKVVMAMGKSSKQTDGMASNYGILNLLKLLYGQYKDCFIGGLAYFCFIFIILPLINLVRSRYPFVPVKVVLSKPVLISLLLLMIISGEVNYLGFLHFFTGVCLLAVGWIFIFNKNRDTSFLLYLGVYILIIHPMGSSTGIDTVIIYSFWIAFPIVLEHLASVSRTDLLLKASAKSGDLDSRFSISPAQLGQAKRISLALLIFAAIYYSYYYPYFDKAGRSAMRYPIHNPHMRGIYTSKARADALNELLDASARFVKPGDYVLAYDCIPLYHYLT
ncbi:MAG TPA: hypothetical protein VG890_15825, partial [Puia sp.]|nr:hypothetical protein [Puia sp.]